MCVLFTRKAVVPVWIIVFGLVFLFSPPTGFPTAVLLLVAGVFVASAIIA